VTVTNFLGFVIVIGGAAWYFMTKDERANWVKTAADGLRSVKDVVILEGLPCADFAEALRARTRHAVAAPALIVLSTSLTLFAWLSPSWGASGWRHVMLSMFAHPSVLELVVGAVCLFQIGLILERLVGWRVFAAVYISAGVVAGIVGLTASSATPSIGAAGSVVAMYGLLLVTSLQGLIRHSELRLPLSIAARLAALAAVFSLCMLMTIGFAHLAPLAALATGVTAGLAVARDVQERTPSLGRLSRCMAIVTVTAAIYAGGVALQPRQEVFDVRPEIDRVIAIEKQTAALYDHAVERFRKGRIPAAALADLIEQTIEPRLRLVAKRLRSLQDVPSQYQPRVATAEEFLQLRDESWRLRAEALHRSDVAALRQADAKERLSLAALQRVEAMD
jgi:membrane associated rhomboid family serine protease